MTQERIFIPSHCFLMKNKKFMILMTIIVILFLTRIGYSITSMPPSTKKGDTAPDFTLESQSGQKITLSHFVHQKVVVLFFYPKDETPGCTAEVCSFRDSFDVFKKAGAEVIGVSSDSTTSHQKFATHHGLPFTLLSDVGGKVRRLYGVPSTLGLMPGRVTYIIDKNGIVRDIFSSQLQPKKHVDAALKVIGGL